MMRALLLGLLILAFAAVASAVIIPIDIPAGPATQRVLAECDALKIELRRPNMTNKACADRFFRIGVRWFHEWRRDRDMRALKTQIQKDAAEAMAEFDADFPEPPPGPTPSPTPTATATPTAAPTATPTPAP